MIAKVVICDFCGYRDEAAEPKGWSTMVMCGPACATADPKMALALVVAGRAHEGHAERHICSDCAPVFEESMRAFGASAKARRSKREDLQ